MKPPDGHFLPFTFRRRCQPKGLQRIEQKNRAAGLRLLLAARPSLREFTHSIGANLVAAFLPPQAFRDAALGERGSKAE
jgi:hypothetical protein